MSVRVLIASAIAFVLWLTLYATIRQMFPSDIIFYQGLILIALVLFVMTLVWAAALLIRLPTGLSGDGWFLATVVAALTMYAFHITVPSLLDRSISLYILGLTEEGSAATESEYRDCFSRGFVQKNGAIEKRLAEQKRTGNLTVGSDGRHRLTARGAAIHSLNKLLVGIFNTDSRYVNPGLVNEESTE